MKKQTVCLPAVLGILFSSVACAAPQVEQGVAGAQTFTLRDSIGHEWKNELIHYELAPKAGEVWPDGARLYETAGKVVPIQWAQLKTHSDGSVAQSELWFIANLPANGTVKYSLKGGARGGKALDAATDLKVAREGDTLVITNAQTGVRVLSGEKKFAAPAEAGQIPAPLQGVKLASGAWTGRGWFETKHRATGYSASLVEDGPVFKKARIRYSFARPEGWGRKEDPFYEMTVQVNAGQEIAYITEEYNLGDPKIYQPPRFDSEKQEMLWDWWQWRPHESPDNFVFSLYNGFKPTHARTVAHNVTDPYKGSADSVYGEREYALPFDKGKEEFNYTLNPWTRFQPDQAIIYTMFRKDDPTSDVVSIIPTMASRWRHPDMLPRSMELIKQHTDTGDIRIYTTNKPDWYLRAPLHLGRREWAIAALRNPGVVTESKDMTVTAALKQKYGALPLDKVKDWVLEWNEATKYPHLYTKAGNLEGLRARIKKEPLLEEAIRKEQHIPANRWMLEGKDEDAQRGYDELVKKLDEKIVMARGWPYAAERTGINSLPGELQTMSLHADMILASPAITAQQRQKLLARFAFMANLVWDGEYFPPRRAGYGWSSANMPVTVAGARGILAAFLSDHPKADEWIEYSKKNFGYIVEHYYAPDGSPFSCPHYMITEGGPVTRVLLALQNTGRLGDIKTAFPALHKYGRFLVDMMPPTDVRLKQRVLPTMGDSYWEGNALAGMMAGLFRESDPQLAGEMMEVWAESGKPLGDAAWYFDPTVAARPDQPRSTLYPGFGTFLHHQPGTSEASYFALHSGDFTIDHMHHDGGAFHWYARGVPISLDWASMYTPQAYQSWWHNTLSYNHQEHAAPVPCPGGGKPGHPNCFYTGKAWYDHKFEPHTALDPIANKDAPNITQLFGKVTAFATEPGADYVRSVTTREWFEKRPYFYREEGAPAPWASFSDFDQVQLKTPFQWTRQVAFVKSGQPDGSTYIVIADDLGGNKEVQPAFNFWCLASNVTQNGKEFHFTGQHGVDLDMFALEGGTDRAQLGEWGHKQTFLIGGEGLEEKQKFVRLHNKADGSGYRVVLYPRKPNEPKPVVTQVADGKAVKVVLPDQTHWIILSPTPVTVSDGAMKFTGTAGVVKQMKDGRIEVTQLAK